MHFVLKNLNSENLAFYGIIEKNMVQTDRRTTDDDRVRREKDATCVQDNEGEDTNTHSVKGKGKVHPLYRH